MAGQTNHEPSFDWATVQLFLRGLKSAAICGVFDHSNIAKPISEGIASWLKKNELAPIAYQCHVKASPEANQLLQSDYRIAAAHNSLHQANLDDILEQLAKHRVAATFFKGAALLVTVYPDQNSRTMSDIDLWIQPEQMELAANCLEDAGFIRLGSNKRRPAALQKLSLGEIGFYREGWVEGLIELHYSAFPGWWLQRTAAIDDEAIWARTTPQAADPLIRLLAPEDNLIQVAVHLAINHQFTEGCIRSLMDLALIAGKQPIDWEIVEQRCRQWRVLVPVWQALTLSDQLFGLEEAKPFLANKPNPVRRFFLKKSVSPAKILQGHRISASWRRFILLLLLVDRPRDALKLLYRTIFPEREWIIARYGRRVTPFFHWRAILQAREL